jgi:hypothetical protein
MVTNPNPEKVKNFQTYRGNDSVGLRTTEYLLSELLMKSQNWEGGIRVPFIAKWKSKIPAGIVNQQPVGIIDVFPTVVKLFNLTLPSGLILDGKDI